ncbi:MAG: hypothetical protein NZ473_07170, partial [Candidatus Kapabacteria bacterium]|nr:hypothetical protein [Candidatus Kapabacteria bacterium]
MFTFSAIAKELQFQWERVSPTEFLLTVNINPPVFVRGPDGMRQVPPASPWAFVLPDRALYGFALPVRLPVQTQLYT